MTGNQFLVEAWSRSNKLIFIDKDLALSSA